MVACQRKLLFEFFVIKLCQTPHHIEILVVTRELIKGRIEVHFSIYFEHGSYHMLLPS